jgi:hypothetical protein
MMTILGLREERSAATLREVRAKPRMGRRQMIFIVRTESWEINGGDSIPIDAQSPALTAGSHLFLEFDRLFRNFAPPSS